MVLSNFVLSDSLNILACFYLNLIKFDRGVCFRLYFANWPHLEDNIFSSNTTCFTLNVSSGTGPDLCWCLALHSFNWWNKLEDFVSVGPTILLLLYCNSTVLYTVCLIVPYPIHIHSYNSSYYNNIKLCLHVSMTSSQTPICCYLLSSLSRFWHSFSCHWL